MIELLIRFVTEIFTWDGLKAFTIMVIFFVAIAAGFVGAES